MERRFFLGRHALNSRPVYLYDRDLSNHFHILGASGKGKSVLLERLCRSFIEQRQGFVCIDPHEDLFKSLLSYLYAVKFPRNKVIIINPYDLDYCVGINYLELNENRRPDAICETVLECFDKVYKSEESFKPRLERWGSATIIPLIKAGLTISDIMHFLLDSTFRNNVLEFIDDDYFKQQWRDFESIKRKEEAMSLIEAIVNRSRRFYENEIIRNIVGQSKTTIDWIKVFEYGYVVLVNLMPSRMVSRPLMHMLGSILVQQIVQAAEERRGRIRKRFYVVLDEFGEYVSRDFSHALRALRKRGLSFILSHQELTQLEEEDRAVVSSVMSNAKVKGVFGVSRDDAERMVKELFTGWIRGDNVKREYWHKLMIPKESVREIISSSFIDSYSQADVSGSSSASISSIMEAQTSVPVIMGDELLTKTGGTTTTSSSGYVSSRSTGRTTSDGITRSQVPFYEYLIEDELSHRDYFSVQEILEKYIAWIKCQGVGKIQLKIDTKRPFPVIVDMPKQYDVSDYFLKKYKERIYSKYDFALPSAEVNKSIEERTSRFSSSSFVIEEEHDEYAGDPLTDEDVQLLKLKRRLKKKESF